MLKLFNNYCTILISIIIFYFIIKTIYNLNKPFNIENFITKYNNQKKLKNNMSFDNLKLGLSHIAAYYVGII